MERESLGEFRIEAVGFTYLPGAETPDRFRERVLRQVAEEWEETHAFLDEIGVPRTDDPRSLGADAERTSLPARVRGLADRLGRAIDERQ